MGSEALKTRMASMFVHGFRALDIAEPLLSIDAERFEEAADSLPDARVVGLREKGRVTHYVPISPDGTPGEKCTFKPEEILHEESSLADAIRILDEHSICFVSVLGDVGAVITREDVEKPPVRMWLFGMLSIFEPYCSRRILDLFPDASWQEHVPTGRLEKAESLRQERLRRGYDTALVDCLQLSDKIALLLRIPEMREDFNLKSRREGSKLSKAIESLRNNLAHNQSIVQSDWKMIASSAERLHRILTRL